jgi:hypothetical protein
MRGDQIVRTFVKLAAASLAAAIALTACGATKHVSHQASGVKIPGLPSNLPVVPTPSGAAPSLRPHDKAGNELPGPGPTPAKLPWTPTLPMTAALSESCLHRGDQVTLTVHAVKGTAVAYQAMYSDGYGGSNPPYGAGYGGNDKGFVHKDGSWVSSWVVSPAAPLGPGRVDVIAGIKSHWGYAHPTFYIAPVGKSC